MSTRSDSPSMNSSESALQSLAQSSSSSAHDIEPQVEKDQSAMNTYTKERRELLETLNSLHSTGVQNELDLPQIVVVGSQSVGKSSLIESMSGIKLPRDTGTCTRCPTECRLQGGPSWTCTVTLRFHVDTEDKPLPEVREVPFGPAVTDKDEVEKVLRRAQRAILRSTLDPSVFLNDEDLHTNEHPAQTFSQNCIIANVGEGGNEQDIALVENLAKSFIDRPNCIILLVISCETDFENQGAGRLVLRDSEMKKRTVGVLTKVDRIEHGSEQKWVDLLHGKENALINGWFCVKQPDPKQLRDNISWEDAKATEKAFFDRTSPWMQLQPRFRRRLGSPGLAEKLSGILSALVSQKLPDIQTEISKQLRFVNDELAELPEPNLTDPKAEVLRLFRDFDRKLAELVEGDQVTSNNATTTGLMYGINQVFARFRNALFATTPHFLPWSSQQQIDEELKKDLMKTATQFDEEGGWTLDDPNIYHLERVMDLALKFDDDLFSTSRTRELPGNYPFLVKKQLIAETVVTWKTLATRCLDEIQEILDDHVKTVVAEHFSQYVLGGLRDTVTSVASEEIRKRFQSMLLQIDNLCNSENTPYTQNDHYFFAYKSKLLGVYKEVYRRSRNEQGIISSLQGFVPNMRPEEENQQKLYDNITAALTHLTALGYQGLTATDLTKLLPEDQNTPALEIMAEVRAYFQVAYKRFSDNVPKQIDTDFIRGTDRDVDFALMSMDLSHEQCAMWLQEDPEVVQKREDLCGRKKRLEAAKDKLGSVVRTSRVGSSA
ncbi:hypothetical protein FRB97_001919 [Tulasnella sp. 331]|nr:hypothetical protein FRB97_001919 [Tulasnella sp. 331]